MAGLIGAWRALIRRHSAGTADPDSCDADEEAYWYGKLSAILRRGGTRLREFFRSARQRMDQARLRRAEVWLEVMHDTHTVRKERRAKRRALSLLMRLLSPEQRQEFRDYGHFHVIGAHTRARYRIRMEVIANIDVLSEDGKIRHRLCVHHAGGVPLYDVMASQLLQLQDTVAEEQLLKQANVVPAPSEIRLYSGPAMFV